MENLPVYSVAEKIVTALQKHRKVLLTASPGAGKSSVVPPLLLERLYHNSGKIVMLEPRRIAARTVAMRIATLLGEPLGKRVGYRVRGESCVGSECQIEVVTEGILTGMLQKNPELSGVSLVIFDEFHERNIQSDLGLALTLEVAEALREDLHILVMSATLECGNLAKLLGNAPIVSVEGRTFPITEHFGDNFGDIYRLPERMAAVVRNVARCETGSILVFLPGRGEIERTMKLLEDMDELYPLYGALPKNLQDQAIAPPKSGVRKIVLATNICESSITIEGISVVIDSGYERVVRYNPATMMSQLLTERISQASATQRAGRAGRLGAGAVYRLWSAEEHRRLEPFSTPEIVNADLANLLLEIALWGGNVNEMLWLDPPAPPRVQVGSKLLQTLGALDKNSKITPLGRAIAKLPVHPRLGAMLMASKELNILPLGCELATLLESKTNNIDLEEQLLTWRRCPKSFPALNMVRDQLLRLFGAKYSTLPEDNLGVLVATAYPEWIAQSRGVPSVNYLLASGRGAKIHDSSDLRRHEFLAVAELDCSGANACIRLATPISRGDIEDFFGKKTASARRVFFDNTSERLVGFMEQKLGAILLKQQRLTSLNSQEILPALISEVQERGVDSLELSRQTKELLARVNFAHKHEVTLYPNWGNSALLESLPQLLSFGVEAKSLKDLRNLDWINILKNAISYNILQELERNYPASYRSPAGSNIRINYEQDSPVLAVRVQELYGEKQHPTVGKSKLPLKLELLSPAQRIIQITTDLPRFWSTNWAVVRKEMRSKYPKHIWPEDPANAEPTTRAKPKAK